jgi:hypothetical protein
MVDKGQILPQRTYTEGINPEGRLNWTQTLGWIMAAEGFWYDNYTRFLSVLKFYWIRFNYKIQGLVELRCEN